MAALSPRHLKQHRTRCVAAPACSSWPWKATAYDRALPVWLSAHANHTKDFCRTRNSAEPTCLMQVLHYQHTGCHIRRISTVRLGAGDASCSGCRHVGATLLPSCPLAHHLLPTPTHAPPASPGNQLPEISSFRPPPASPPCFVQNPGARPDHGGLLPCAPLWPDHGRLLPLAHVCSRPLMSPPACP